MKIAFYAEQQNVQAWIERLPETFRSEARSAIRTIELVITGYTFELQIEDDGAGLWFVQGQKVGEAQKTPHPFVTLENYPNGINITFNIFTEAEGGLYAAVEFTDQPNICTWRVYAGEDLAGIQDKSYLALRAAMYELRGSTVTPLEEARATMIMQAMMESLDAP